MYIKITAGTLLNAPVLLVGSTTARRNGNCRAMQTRRCPNAAAAATNTIWSFGVSGCEYQTGITLDLSKSILAFAEDIMLYQLFLSLFPSTSGSQCVRKFTTNF